MEITIKGEAKEIAVLITAIKERQSSAEVVEEINEGLLRCGAISRTQEALEKLS